MTYLVTGAAGWVGSWVVRELVARGERVCALARPGAELARLEEVREQIRLLECDLADEAGLREAIAAADADVCFHLAWYAVPGEYLSSRQNLACLDWSLRLVELLEAAGCKRFVGAGTCFEYDLAPGYLAESNPTGPSTLYGAAKLSFALLASRLLAQSPMEFIWARLFYLYGPGEDSRRLVPSVIRGLLSGVAVPLTRGDQVRDYVHVRDAARALVHLAVAGGAGVVNVGSGSPVTVAHVAHLLATMLRRPELIHLGALARSASDPPFVCANVDKLKAAYGWQPCFDLEAGLRDSVDWWSAVELTGSSR
jgi:nucleoside-diphosphate-sugar epimerase